MTSIDTMVRAGLIHPQVAARPGFKLAEERELDDNEVAVYGPIVPDGEFEGADFVYTTPSAFANAMKSAEGDEILIRVDSPGGVVWSGANVINAVREAQKKRKRKVNVLVEGIAASAASWLVFAADELFMSELSEIFVHRAQGVAIGDANTMTAMAASMQKTDDNMAAFYESSPRLKALGYDSGLDIMDGDAGFGTFVTAREAVDAGAASMYNMDVVDDVEAVVDESLQLSAQASLALIQIHNHRR